jgi:hypothetical protein
VTDCLVRGVEGPRRCLFYPCRSELFNHRSPHPADSPRSVPEAENKGLPAARYARRYIYILGSPTGTFYIGVASNLYRRVKCGPQQIPFSGFDKSVRRSAQDDDFVGALTKNILNKLAFLERSPHNRF